MIPALNLNEIEQEIEKKYRGRYFSKIVGVMVARYPSEIVKNIFKEDLFDFWNDLTNEDFHVLWIGYGKYLLPEEETPYRYIIDGSWNINRVFFDRCQYASSVNTLQDEYNISCYDQIQLILTNYFAGKIHLNENRVISFGDDVRLIEKRVNMISALCRNEEKVEDVMKKLSVDYVKDKLKNISFQDVQDLINILKEVK